MYKSSAAILVAFVGIVHSATIPPSHHSGPKFATLYRRESGVATITNETPGGQCMLGASTPGGLPGMALPDASFGTAEHCGGCVKITSDKCSVVAVVMDRCPECEPGHVDLWPAARAGIGYPGYGSINPQVTWEFADCSTASSVPKCGDSGSKDSQGGQDFSQGTTTTTSTEDQTTPSGGGGLSIHVKDGVNQWWFAAQVRGGSASAMSCKKSDGNWGTMYKTSYNYFVLDGGTGSDTTDCKVTSNGSEVTISGVPVQSDADKAA